ncbi:MAG: hypothetical protein ACRC7O_00445 [Fimbriiglobus sp.]
MQPSIIVSSPVIHLPPLPPGPPPDVPGLLLQMLEVQKEQLTLLKNQAVAQDGLARWRAFLGRWQTDFPEIGASCKEVLPVIERAYLTMIRELTERVRDDGPDALENEFALAEFLDRYGVRLGQLGTILGQLGPLADATPVPATAPSPDNPG